MKFRRIISMFLAVLFMLSMCAVTVSAADTSTGTDASTPQLPAEKVTYTYYTASGVVRNQYFKDTKLEWTSPVAFDTPAEKLQWMDLRLQKDGYQIYVDEYSGEVACRDMTTDDVLFTNPYNIGNSGAKGSLPYELMSQLIIQYKDKSVGTIKTFTSFEEASVRGQLKVKNIKNGIRVEYTIGREEAKMLVPRLIEKSRFHSRILSILAENLKYEGGVNSLKYKKVAKYYQYFDLKDAINDVDYENLIAKLPILRKMAVYALHENTTTTQMAQIELLIKTYAPSYSYEDLDYDHELTEYEGEEQSPPLFKLALEYTISPDGLTVTLPANGLRFDESRYTLENIKVLPYMGSGCTPNPGYTFFPDGSGAIFDFEDLAETTETQVSGQIYGMDYAYQTITATHQEVIRVPVFGIAETQTLTSIAPNGSQKIEEVDRGYLAIIEEGDSMARLTSYHGGQRHEYHAIQMEYYPRPKDSYNIKDAISSTTSGSGAMWEVVSSRKYTGNYTIRYTMLTDTDVANRVKHDLGDAAGTYYEPSYVGMAEAYRDYLIGKGVLNALTEEDVTEDIPLYLNVFGSIETTEKIMSIPVEVTVPLTSFQDIMTMREELAAEGVENLNFKLTGFANGGMYATAPYRLKWEKAVGGADDFELLLKDAAEKGYKVFPDFDFVYVSETGLFDGLNLRKHVVKSIDNRYTSRREYSATKQAFVSYFELCLSPAYFEHFYTKFTENYLKYFADEYKSAISVGTLGSELNSDFDEDEPYNREDSKGYTIEAFQYLRENYDYIMTSGGNAYTWQYVDYILDIPLDSSRFIKAAASVPFIGMVLHGYIQFAGTPINMEGNIDYAFLKAIENGASINFIVSYQNTTTLKEDVRLSKYYSVRYDIWVDDIVEIYSELNSLLSDLQLETIIDHEFIAGERVPDLDEIADDFDQAILDSIGAEAGALNAQEKEYIATILTARQTIRKNSNAVLAEIEKLEDTLDTMKRLVGYSVDTEGNVSYTSVQLNNAITNFRTAIQNFINVYNGGNCQANILGAESAKVNEAARTLQNLYNQTQSNSINYYAEQAYKSEITARTAYLNALEAYELLESVDGISDYIKELAWEQIDSIAASVARVGMLAPDVYTIAHETYEYAVNGSAEILDADGKKVCEVNAYQFYLFAVCRYLTVNPTTRLNTEYLLQRYEIGLDKTDLTAKAALDQICNSLKIENPTAVPAYKEIFDAYLNPTGSTRLGFNTRYTNFKTMWDTYNEVYEKYQSKQATSAELEAALKPLTATAKLLNTEFSYLIGAFNSAKASSNMLSPLYDVDTVPASVLEKVNAFSAAYTAFNAAEKPSASEITAMATAADALNEILDSLSSQYVIIAKDSSAGINSYALAAEKHVTTLQEAYDVAKHVYDRLAAKLAAMQESDEGYAALADSVAIAKEYLDYTADQLDDVKGDAEAVIKLANDAYTNASSRTEIKNFMAAVEALTLKAEEDENLFYVTAELSNRLNPYNYVEEEDEEILDEEEIEIYDKYLSDDNNIVLVTYSNGARFLLNYCNYAVVVEVDGVFYRVESQNYQKVPRATESEVETSDN